MASTDTNSKEVIDVLNDLIETSKDGEEGFKECAENVERSYLKTLVKERARECKTAATELQIIVQRLGGTPQDDASATGSLHRRWTALKATLTGNREAPLNSKVASTLSGHSAGTDEWLESDVNLTFGAGFLDLYAVLPDLPRIDVDHCLHRGSGADRKDPRPPGCERG
jgi:hypothetical protein